VTASSLIAIGWVEQELVPDSVVRQGIRRLLARRLQEIRAHDCDVAAEAE